MAKLGIILRETIIYCSSVLWARHEKALSVRSRWDGKVPMSMRTMLLPKAIPYFADTIHVRFCFPTAYLQGCFRNTTGRKVLTVPPVQICRLLVVCP
jgi:hypothetical protein